MIEILIKFTIIYINYFVITSIVKQINLNTVSTEKLNFYFIQTFKYLQQFCLNIRYKSDKSNIIFDILFHLISQEYKSETNELLNILFA